MTHLPKLIEDLALILIAAGLVTLLFRRIKQPVVLGYILAGFLVGPHFSPLPSITDPTNVQIWADIGVIFLLFGLGLEFSFRKLARVGGAASVTATFEVVAMTSIGYIVGQFFGWNTMDSLFLGGILAISSTTIIIRAFDELGVKSRGYVKLVFGVLVVEDLVAIILLVLLSTVAISNQVDGSQLLGAVVKLAFFLVLWTVAGVFLLPLFLKRIRTFVNEETLLVFSVGLCFLMVVMTTQAGFSPALGAFMMGSILAETPEGKRVEHLIEPVKNLFGAVFFVSVGMLIDPKILTTHALPIFILTIVTIVGKLLSTTGGALLAGQNLKHSVQAGMSLAQIGEFSFIIATLGLSLNVTSAFLYPIAVGISAVTTLTTPFMIRKSDWMYEFIERKLPRTWLQGIASYSGAANRPSSISDWRLVVRAYITQIGVNAVLITGIFLALARYLPSVLGPMFEDSRVVNGLGLTIAIIASSPFIWALVMTRPRREKVQKLWREPGSRSGIIVLEAARIGVVIALFAFLAPQFIAIRPAIITTIIMTIVFIFVFSRRLAAIYQWIERRFFENLIQVAPEEKNGKIPPLAPWDAHIARLIVHPDAPLVGQTLIEAKVRENYGVTIALIERGHRLITAPTRHERFFPHDHISVIGTDDQIDRFRKVIELTDIPVHVPQESGFGLHLVSIDKESKFAGRTIRDSQIRELTHGLVVGVERNGKRILNPGSELHLEAGDSLWIVGENDLIRIFQN